MSELSEKLEKSGRVWGVRCRTCKMELTVVGSFALQPDSTISEVRKQGAEHVGKCGAGARIEEFEVAREKYGA